MCSYTREVATAQSDIDPLALERQVCFALAAASRSVIGVYKPVLEPMGLTHPQYLVMLALWERSPRSLRELGEVLHLDPGTLSPLVKRLERAGLVVRERDARDERNLALTLTAGGRKLRRKAEKVPAQVIARLGVPLEELEQARVVLMALLEAASRATSV